MMSDSPIQRARKATYRESLMNERRDLRHDEIVMWVEDNLTEILAQLWEDMCVEEFSTTWEHVVYDSRRNQVGYIDLWVDVSVLRRDLSFGHRTICFDVKPEIESLGDVIRQIRRYQGYLGGADFVIVSPDDRHAVRLESQGIRFVKYPRASSFEEGEGS